MNRGPRHPFVPSRRAPMALAGRGLTKLERTARFLEGVLS